MAQDNNPSTSHLNSEWGRHDKPASGNAIESWGAGDKEVEVEPPARGLKGWGQDIAATAVKGAIAVPEAVVGVADIATGGRVGKFLENEGGAVGFRPKQAREIVNDWHSDATKEAQQKFEAAEGIGAKFKTALENPSLIATAIGESLPSMALGGALARGLVGATRLGQMGTKGAVAAGAIGEGVTMAGSQAEAIRQETSDGLLTPAQAGLAATTGVVGGAIGAVGGRVAQKLGVGDVDTMMAQGSQGMVKQFADDATTAATNAATNPLVQQAAAKSIPRKVIEGAIAEGLLEELPQSVAEQVFQNVALNKDWHEDVDAAIVMGVLTGGTMGAGAAGYSAMREPRAKGSAMEQAEVAAIQAVQAAAADPAQWTTSAGATDTMAAGETGLASDANAPVADATNFSTSPGAAPDYGNTVNFQRDFATDGLSLAENPIGEQVGPQPSTQERAFDTGALALGDPTPSQRMGLNPNDGTMSAAAALAVDSGATGQMQAAAEQARAAEAAQKAGSVANKKERQLQQQPAIDADTGEIQQGSEMSSWSDEQLSSVFRGAQSKDVRMALAQELGRRRTAREQQELQDELDAEMASSAMPNVPDSAFARTTEDAGPLPDSIEIQSTAQQAQPAINQGVNKDGTQTNQTQQSSPQPAQAGRTQGKAPAALSAGEQLAQQIGRESSAARSQRQLDANERWMRMTAAERKAAAGQAKGLNVVARANVHTRPWADLNPKHREALLQVLSPPLATESIATDFDVSTEGVDKQVVNALDNAQAAIDFDKSDASTAVSIAAQTAATSPTNELPVPTEAQKEAGNYRKGHVRLNGHDISIENPAGSSRRPEWPPLQNHYGYIKGSMGADKDHVDVFMTDRAHEADLPVFVVDQVNQDGSFDEHKVVMGAADETEARSTYLGNYAKGWTGLGAITQMSQDDFKTWVRDSAKTKKPAGRLDAKPDAANAFPLKQAESSYSGISHSGGQRAKADATEFEQFISSEREAGMTVAETEAQKAAVEKAVEALRTDYLAAYGRLMGVRSGSYSGYVAGRSGLNTKQANRRNDALSRAQDTFSAWQKAAEGIGRRAAMNARTAEQKQADQHAKDSAAADKAQRLLDGDRKLIRKVLSWKKGGEPLVVGKSAQVTGVNYGRDGYPTSVNLVPTDGSTLTDNKFDLAALMRRPGVSVPESKRRVRELVDAVRAEDAEQPKPAATEQAPDAAGKTPMLDFHVELMDQVREGKATADQMRESFQRLDAQRDAIAAELSTMNKDRLLRSGGYSFAMRHRDSKKAEIVAAMVDAVLGEYSLGRQYGPSSYILSSSGMVAQGKAKAQALRELVANLTDDDIAQHAKEIAESRAELKARREASQQALDNPKTLADYRGFVSHWIEKGETREAAFLRLSPEQRKQYDALEAESTRAARDEAKRKAKTAVATAGDTTGSEVIATKHTKHGHELFAVQLADRVERDAYTTLNNSAKRLGGSYSSYRGNGAIPGFQFRSRESAEAFRQLVNGDTTQAETVANARRDAFDDDKSQSASERLNTMAEALDSAAEESLNADRKVNTARRARFAAGAEAAARYNKSLAGTMRNVANAIDDGSAKFVDGVRQKIQVEHLMSALRTAKDKQLRAKYPSYADQERHKGEPLDSQTVDFADWPEYTMFRSDWASLARQLLEVDGGKKLGASLLKTTDDVTDAYSDWAKANLLAASQFYRGEGAADFPTREGAESAIKRGGLVGKAVVLAVKRGQNRVILSPGEAMQRGLWAGDGDKRIKIKADFVDDLMKLGKRRGSKALAMPWQLEGAYEKRQRLARMGILTPAEYRSALREFAQLQQEMGTPDRIKELERAMVGRKADGLDFFPTSPAVVSSMLEAAEIHEGMAVLEPSAGMGHIADAIVAETGVWPDVVELSGERRELLELKGFHLADANDFTQLQPRAFFTFGDTFRAPDGTEGVMRGSGGMGSQRVRLVGKDGNGLGFYDRSELEGVAQNGTQSGYDRIVMNPPFSDGRDIQHVQHAYSLLRPGGRIVAIMGEGAFFQSNKRAEGFREWLDKVGGTSEKLPEGSFMDPSLPVNTGVAARMVVIEKAVDAPVFRRGDVDAPAFDVQGFLGVMNKGQPAFSDKARAQAVGTVKGTVDAIRKAWANGPEVVVAFDMADPVIPEAARQADLKQRSGGALGAPEGFYFEGKAYLMASQLKTPNDAARVLFHEVLGHHGLRGVFGSDLNKILNQIVAMRKAEVDAKIKEYGLRGVVALDRRVAAEEVLAELAQSTPKLHFVQRAVAAIRTWLRKHVPGFRSLALSDDELIRNFILPARAWVERGGQPDGGGSDRRTLFSRDGQGTTPSLDTFPAELMSELAEVDELFMNPAVHAGSAEAALRQVDPTVKLIGDVTAQDERQESGADSKLLFRTGNGKDFYVFEKASELWLDVSRLGEGDGGSAIYSALMGYAASNDMVFIGDPAGLSDVAMRRRLEAMLSSAIKYGNTDHMQPHPRQVAGDEKLGMPGLQWRQGDTIGNIQRMIDVSLASIAAQVPEFKRARYDFDTGTYRNSQGAPLSDEVLGGWVSEFPRMRAASVGLRTIKRGILLNTLAQTESGQRPRLLEQALRQPRQLVGEQAHAVFYSRSKLADLKDKGVKLAHDALTHPGKVSMWDKTVGTMRHVSERYPAFKPVFEAAQQFIDDVSSVANQAAQVAPRLIPRVETLNDMRKKPISVVDNRAIGKALFGGTLDWGRDQHGKAMPMDALRDKYRGLTVDQKAEVLLAAKKITPQMMGAFRAKKLEQFETIINDKFESTILKAGAAFNHKELKEFFNLNEQQISLYDEARATVDKSLDITARAEMLRTLGRDWDGMRDIVMDAPTLTEAWKLLDDELEHRAKQYPDTRDRLAAQMHQLSTTLSKAQELMDHGYMPLQRFGKYTLDVLDKNGERLYYGMFESKTDSHKMLEVMRREFPDAKITQGTMNEHKHKLMAGITPETAELFGSMLGLDAEGNQEKDKAFQEYLKLAKNNHSAMKRLIHRKGILGYSDDVGRVLASFVYSNARVSATGLNAGKMETAINDLNTKHKEEGELGEIAAKLRSYIQDPQEEGQAMRGMLFAQYLGGSLASAAVNMTQPFAVTLPWLSQYGGMAKASKYMSGALRDMVKRGNKYEADLAHALKMAEDDGTVSPQEIHQLMAQSRGAGGLRSGDGTKKGDARAAALNAWEKGKVAWGQPFALAEQFNRRSTFIAAYRLARDRGMDSPAQFARDAVVETQFLYTKANKPQWARGAIGGTLFTFKTYSVSFLELMHRTWNAGESGSPERAAGRRAVGWAMLMLMLMGGAGGLPFVEDVEDLVDGAGQMMGYNLSSKQWRKDLMREVLGGELAEFMDSGLSGMPGAPIDVSGRLGMGNLIPGTGLFLDKQSNTRDMVEMLGPAGDLVARGFSGAKSVASGVINRDAASIGRGAMEVMPTAVRNLAKGRDMAFSGMYKDSKSYKVVDTTLDEALWKAIGFQPRSVAEVQESNSFVQRTKSFYTQTSNDIRAQWAKALFEKDEAAVRRVRERLAQWNEQNPELPIRIRMPDIWERARNMAKDRTQRIADTAPTAIRQQMREFAARE